MEEKDNAAVVRGASDDSLTSSTNDTSTPARAQEAYAKVPSLLKNESRWVNFKLELRDDKSTKVPYDPKNPRHKASSIDPATWAGFETACQAAKSGAFDGIGFVLGDGWAGVDMDHVLDPQTGRVKLDCKWARELVKLANSYSEGSYSGDGIHVIVRGQLPSGARKRSMPGGAAIEMYDNGRFFVVTGRHITITPETVEERTAEIAEIHERFLGSSDIDAAQPVAFPNGSGPLSEADEALLRQVFDGRNGEKFRAAFEGDTTAYEGNRSSAELGLCGHLAVAGADATTIDRIVRNSGLMRPKWDERRPIHGTYGRKTIAKALHVSADLMDKPNWGRERKHPTLQPAALYGLAGDVVRAIGLQSEGDPAAILTTFIASFGNAVGSGPRVQIGAVKQCANLFFTHVGDTGRGRKGQGYKDGSFVVRKAAQAWHENAIVSGLGSGEGLIAKLSEIEREKTKASEAASASETTPLKRNLSAISAPQAFLYEPEFSRLLAAASRDGATVSAILRDAWDAGRLELRVRNGPLVVNESYVSAITQITREELRERLNDTDIANGFANRFLLIAVRRSKLLPRGGDLESVAIQNLVARVRTAIEAARNIGRVDFDEAAGARWAQFYAEHAGRSGGGLASELLVRGDTQVLRLSLIFALVDGLREIGLPHLEAAIAVWAYAEESARYIFGETLGDSVAQRLLDAVRDAYPGGLPRTRQAALFNRHRDGARLASARDRLVRAGLAEERSEPGSGRSSTLLYAIPCEISERSEISPPADPLISHSSLISQARADAAVATSGAADEDLGDDLTAVSPAEAGHANEKRPRIHITGIVSDGKWCESTNRTVANGKLCAAGAKVIEIRKHDVAGSTAATVDFAALGLVGRGESKPRQSTQSSYEAALRAQLDAIYPVVPSGGAA